MQRYKKYGSRWGWRLLILSTAVFLRLYKLTSLPPGLTHDEADHGITAWSIANDGVRDLYFTIGYGREPLYDYVTAVLMKITGPVTLAPRLISAWAGILLIAAMYRWARDTFDERTALFTAASLAVSFWAAATSRQALRSELLPLLFVLALLFYWKGIGGRKTGIGTFVGAGIFLGLSFYTYIPSRGLWFVFPSLFLFGWVTERERWRNVWKQTAVTLTLSLLIAAPLFIYLRAHPNTEERIDELKTPLTAVLDGNIAPLLQNIGDGLRIIGSDGDWIARYNIPHQPLLPPAMNALFILELLLILRAIITSIITRKRKKKPFFVRKISVPLFAAILWLLAGLAPVLITGPEWSFTQAIGMQPVLYLFPALALAWLNGWTKTGRWFNTGVLILFGATAVLTYNTYFIIWGQDPAVRVQYESTMVAAMEWLNENGHGEAAVSTITPAPFHTPALAKMTMQNDDVTLHYFNARAALLLPDADESSIILPNFTPIPAAMERYWQTAVLIHTLPLRPDDEDRPLDIYSIKRSPTLAIWADQFTTAAPAGNAYLTFLGVDLQTETVRAGETARVATWWQIKRPLTQANLFTHIQGSDRIPIAQADQLDVPSEGWQAGDHFIQLHEIHIPADTPSGRYPIAFGLCRRQAQTCPRIGDLIEVEIEIEVE